MIHVVTKITPSKSVIIAKTETFQEALDAMGLTNHFTTITDTDKQTVTFITKDENNSEVTYIVKFVK